MILFKLCAGFILLQCQCYLCAIIACFPKKQKHNKGLVLNTVNSTLRFSAIMIKAVYNSSIGTVSWYRLMAVTEFEGVPCLCVIGLDLNTWVRCFLCKQVVGRQVSIPAHYRKAGAHNRQCYTVEAYGAPDCIEVPCRLQGLSVTCFVGWG